MYPTNEKISVVPLDTLILKLPSTSVIVPVGAPFTATETPGIVNPSLSVTVPEIDISCAEIELKGNNKRTNSRHK